MQVFRVFPGDEGKVVFVSKPYGNGNNGLLERIINRLLKVKIPSGDDELFALVHPSKIVIFLPDEIDITRLKEIFFVYQADEVEGLKYLELRLEPGITDENILDILEERVRTTRNGLFECLFEEE